MKSILYCLSHQWSPNYKENVAFVTIEIDLQSITLSEISQRKTNTISYIVQSLKKLFLTETESRMMVARV